MALRRTDSESYITEYLGIRRTLKLLSCRREGGGNAGQAGQFEGVSSHIEAQRHKST
jgi:hypothetical protein